MHDADDRIYLTAPETIAEIAERLATTWDSIRIRTRALGLTEAEPIIAEVPRTRRALPSQWLPSLTTRRLTDG